MSKRLLKGLLKPVSEPSTDGGSESLLGLPLFRVRVARRPAAFLFTYKAPLCWSWGSTLLPSIIGLVILIAAIVVVAIIAAVRYKSTSSRLILVGELVRCD